MNFYRNFAKCFRKWQNLSRIWYNSRKMHLLSWCFPGFPDLICPCARKEKKERRIRKKKKEKIAPSGKKAGTDRFYFRIKGNLFFWKRQLVNAMSCNWKDEAKKNNNVKSRIRVLGKTKPSKTCLALSTFKFIPYIFICREGVPAFRAFLRFLVWFSKLKKRINIWISNPKSCQSNL